VVHFGKKKGHHLSALVITQKIREKREAKFNPTQEGVTTDPRSPHEAFFSGRGKGGGGGEALPIFFRLGKGKKRRRNFL